MPSVNKNKQTKRTDTCLAYLIEISGIISCLAQLANARQESEASLQIISVPTVTISPITATKSVGSRLRLECTVTTADAGDYEIIWHENDMELQENGKQWWPQEGLNYTMIV